MQSVELLADGLHAIANLTVGTYYAGTGTLSACSCCLMGRDQALHRVTDRFDLLTQSLLGLLGVLASHTKALQLGLCP
ncbi:hypothetical protein [Comamonas fluminis]|uniref:hypothetical protein n=1 Tax=Comamonas fluminis TaxID=2796366 RepID=UPI001FE2BB70|nr:hypothetical protein [Comamonas fluminis]